MTPRAYTGRLVICVYAKIYNLGRLTEPTLILHNQCDWFRSSLWLAPPSRVRSPKHFWLEMRKQWAWLLSVDECLSYQIIGHADSLSLPHTPWTLICDKHCTRKHATRQILYIFLLSLCFLTPQLPRIHRMLKVGHSVCWLARGSGYNRGITQCSGE
jgi:hypothetical protein